MKSIEFHPAPLPTLEQTGNENFTVDVGIAEERRTASTVLPAQITGSTDWRSVFEELRELVWLASLTAGLSALGVGIAVALGAS